MLGETCILRGLKPSADFQTNFRLTSLENYCLEGRMSDVSFQTASGFYRVFISTSIEAIMAGRGFDSQWSRWNFSVT